LPFIPVLFSPVRRLRAIPEPPDDESVEALGEPDVVPPGQFPAST
jgi:hypothetical protein